MDNCVSEVLIRQVADAIVRLGLKTLGYQYINLDDCVSVYSDCLVPLSLVLP